MKPKYFMNQGKEYKIVCSHYKQFPPIEMTPLLVKDRGSLEDQRAAKLITDDRYRQIQVWQKRCGLLEMEKDKCLSCSNCRLAEDHPIRGEVLKTVPAFMQGTKK